MSVQTAVNVAYSDDQSDLFRQFDVYFTSGSTEPAIIFVHGGAWRSEDKSDFVDLANSLVQQTRCAVFVPNYRLTTSTNLNFKHPGHARDILQFLSFLVDWKHPEGLNFDAAKLFLLGHSCSAHMLASIFLDSPYASLRPRTFLLERIRAIIMSEGIYQIDLLLDHFPKYKEWFIEAAFGPHDSFTQFNATNLSLRNNRIRWLFIHSKGDSLVDVAQSEVMLAHLQNLYDAAAHTHVEANFDTLQGEHNDILHSSAYVQIVADFI
ncbi:Alpha/Beta hydrolase protein, partial [Mycena floridula]